MLQIIIKKKNALALVNAGAAEIILEKELTAAQLIKQLDHCLLDETYQNKMKQAAKQLGLPDAAKQLCDLVVGLTK